MDGVLGPLPPGVLGSPPLPTAFCGDADGVAVAASDCRSLIFECFFFGFDLEFGVPPFVTLGASTLPFALSLCALREFCAPPFLMSRVFVVFATIVRLTVI